MIRGRVLLDLQTAARADAWPGTSEAPGLLASRCDRHPGQHPVAIRHRVEPEFVNCPRPYPSNLPAALGALRQQPLLPAILRDIHLTDRPVSRAPSNLGHAWFSPGRG